MFSDIDFMLSIIRTIEYTRLMRDCTRSEYKKVYCVGIGFKNKKTTTKKLYLTRHIKDIPADKGVYVWKGHGSKFCFLYLT